MIPSNIRIKLSDLILSLSKSLDFVNPKIANHHLRVAIIASEIAKEFGLSQQEISNIFLASTIHDIGAFSLKERLNIIKFEIENPYQHAEKGYLLIKDFPLFSDISKLIRYHHISWAEGDGKYFHGEDVPISSHAIHLADRIDALINKEAEVLSQRQAIMDIIKSHSNRVFVPELVEAFENLTMKEYFWFDTISPEIERIILDRDLLPNIELNIQELLNITRLFSHIVDYRSPFTAVHSAGVSAVATVLAEMIGFSETECKMMRVAGYLHDIGKLAVPSEILEKPDKLSTHEFNVMKSHAYHSYRILEGITGFDTINAWGSLHHERINGKGYPFHLKGSELQMGSRIMAVADVFTAITEDRPYRKGLSGEESLKVIEGMAKNNALDLNIAGAANTYFIHINDVRLEAQIKAREEFLAIKQS